MTRPLLFVAADPRECAEWVARWDNLRPLPLAVHWARAGKWKGHDAIAIANGAGAMRAFAAVALTGSASAVYSIGFCGALDKSLRVGDIVVAGEIRNGARTFTASVPPGLSAGATAVSIDHVALTAAEKSNLRATGASIVDMEAAGVARAANDLGVPFYCIRAVSDLADEDFANDLNASLMPDGRFSAARLMIGALASPSKRFRELVRLKQRAAVAAKNLGDFLADCPF